MALLEVDHVYKNIKQKQILNNICFCASSEHIYGFCGENGAGKTMLFKVIAGLVCPTRGKILYNQKTFAPNRFDIRIGIVTEHTSLYPRLSAYENLLCLARLNNFITSDEIKSVISLVGLDPQNDKPFGEFSLGMKQRLLIAQAIMEKPHILLLDEPTNAIDKAGVQLVLDIVQKQKERGAIILVSSHISDDIQQLCDTFFEMKQGSIVNVF